MTTLIRCPGCNQLRRPGPTCDQCTIRRRQRQRRAQGGLAIACAILALTLLALVLSACTEMPTGPVSTTQPPATAPAPTPTPSGPPPLTGANISEAWRRWANGQGYCWCEWQSGQPILIGDTCAPEVLDSTRAAQICPARP